MSITDITTQMLNRYKDNPSSDEEQRQAVLASAYILQILSEKRVEYKDKRIQFDYIFKPESCFSFIKIEPINFRRLLSNLINNAVDALENKVDGKITIQLSITTEYVVIVVKDNGKGMSEDIVNKIENNIAITENKVDGHGIGMTQVQDTLKKSMGLLKIYSIPEQGTDIRLFFPKISAPNWIADSLIVGKDDTIVILDDDSSIHAAWDTKLAPILQNFPDIEVEHFQQGEKVINYINGLSDKDKKSIFLLSDYELLNQNLNGLDVIRQVNLAKKQSTLVTSHYFNVEIRKEAHIMGTKILPKNLVHAIQVKVDKKIEPHSKIVDIVWVDDEKTYIECLIDKHYKHLKVDTFYDPFSFLENIELYPLDTKIIMDNYYYTETGSYPITGVDLAQQLHDKGYKNLYLLSGEPLDREINYLTVIVKTDNQKIQNLDKLKNRHI